MSNISSQRKAAAAISRKRTSSGSLWVGRLPPHRHPGPERQSRLRLATSHLASRLSPQYSRSPHHIKYCPAGAPSPTVWTAISKDQLRTCIDTLRVQASGGANRVMLFPLIQSSAKVRFEPRPQKIGGTWVLIATHPSGQQEHIVGFHTEAEADEWRGGHGLQAWFRTRG